MVWCLMKPQGFGDYWPDGEFVGWKEPLKKYYDNEMPHEKKVAMGMTKRIYYSEFSKKFSKDLGRLEAVECPKEFLTIKKYNNLADLIDTQDRLLAVSEALKSIIEDVEPEVHQFWPLKIISRRGEAYPVNYYGMVVGRFLDSFDYEQSRKENWRHSGDSYVPRSTMKKKDFSEMVMSAKVIGGAHLWREPKVSKINLYFSDELQERIERAGLRLFKRYKLKDV
ncbi:imm11 family protein [Phaeobacter inhibens]|uniref:imm11 family protein n=1 Tax=Phaeobacter inhibens TaxID=221822 RepID=UPI000CA180A6|nr:DUF1629 domain-containing protein [Phaeobacter inhibens]AUQ65764.1 hypothetical protein PhaeoP78_00883 [Phaeobacter inhibens]